MSWLLNLISCISTTYGSWPIRTLGHLLLELVCEFSQVLVVILKLLLLIWLNSWTGAFRGLSFFLYLCWLVYYVLVQYQDFLLVLLTHHFYSELPRPQLCFFLSFLQFTSISVICCFRDTSLFIEVQGNLFIPCILFYSTTCTTVRISALTLRHPIIWWQWGQSSWLSRWLRHLSVDVGGEILE